jgi:hypothetical protein
MKHRSSPPLARWDAVPRSMTISVWLAGSGAVSIISTGTQRGARCGTRRSERLRPIKDVAQRSARRFALRLASARAAVPSGQFTRQERVPGNRAFAVR